MFSFDDKGGRHRNFYRVRNISCSLTVITKHRSKVEGRASLPAAIWVDMLDHARYFFAGRVAPVSEDKACLAYAAVHITTRAKAPDNPPQRCGETHFLRGSI